MSKRRRPLDDRSPSKRPTCLEYLPLTAIAPDPGNPRLHPREQTNAIARSIDAFGFNAPILVDRQNRIIAGHGRLEAAKTLGLAEVPIIRLEHLTEAQARAYMLADNKLTDRSSWDDGRLAVVLKELSEISLDFSIEATGFQSPEIDLRIQSLAPPDDADEADDFDVPDDPPASAPGDVWILGDHRLICGSALDPQSYDRLLGHELAAAVFTDPPYNVPIRGHVGGKGRVQHREFLMASGEMSAEEFARFLRNSLRLTSSFAKDGATFFACMDWRHIAEISAAIQAVGSDVLNVCVWVKPNGGMGSLYRSRHELIFVFGKRSAKRKNNVQLGQYGRNRTNVWNYAGANSFSRKGRVRGLDLHPTVKPIAMVADAILDVTDRGDVILDPFCGSGTTLLAAERTGRRGFGIELDATYVDVAVLRWQRLTKRSAVHESGKTFEQVRAERCVPPEVKIAEDHRASEDPPFSKRKGRP